MDDIWPMAMVTKKLQRCSTANSAELLIRRKRPPRPLWASVAVIVEQLPTGSKSSTRIYLPPLALSTQKNTHLAEFYWRLNSANGQFRHKAQPILYNHYILTYILHRFPGSISCRSCLVFGNCKWNATAAGGGGHRDICTTRIQTTSKCRPNILEFDITL